MRPPGKKRENPGILLSMDFRPRWGVIFSLPPCDPTQDPKASSSDGRPHYYETPKNKTNIDMHPDKGVGDFWTIFHFFVILRKNMNIFLVDEMFFFKKISQPYI